jgi:hypothetical protein
LVQFLCAIDEDGAHKFCPFAKPLKASGEARHEMLFRGSNASENSEEDDRYDAPCCTHTTSLLTAEANLTCEVHALAETKQKERLIMASNRTDFLVIGGGIAGASVAYELSATSSVILLEAENATGYHSTGRSAAVMSENYGPALWSRLVTASRTSSKTLRRVFLRFRWFCLAARCS